MRVKAWQPTAQVEIFGQLIVASFLSHVLSQCIDQHSASRESREREGKVDGRSAMVDWLDVGGGGVMVDGGPFPARTGAPAIMSRLL